MRKSASSMLSSGATGAGAGTAGSRAGVQAAATATAAHIPQTALGTVGIGGDGGSLSGGLIADDDGEVRRDRDPFRLLVPILVEPAATQHLAGRAYLGEGLLRPGDEQIRSRPGMPCEPGAAEPLL